LALIQEIGYCNGIENYSRHFSGKAPGEPPDTLLSYFPHKADGSADFLTIIDESHVTVPQLNGMYAGDKSRKDTLVEHGFRLPSARDNRPLKFDEFETGLGKLFIPQLRLENMKKKIANKQSSRLFGRQVLSIRNLLFGQLLKREVIKARFLILLMKPKS
jgi:hypothetical protein